MYLTSCNTCLFTLFISDIVLHMEVRQCIWSPISHMLYGECRFSFLSIYQQTKPENRKARVVNFHITIPDTLTVKYTMFQNSFNYLGLFFCIQNVIFFPLLKQYLGSCSSLSPPLWSWSFNVTKITAKTGTSIWLF